MRIKFTTSIAGSNFSHKPGDEVDWPDKAEAQRFVAAGYATPVEQAKPDAPRKPRTERADIKAGGEQATLKR